MKTMKSKQVDFSNGRILENIVMCAAPMLVAQLLNLMYNIVDRIYIGKIEGIGVVALGGVGLCFPIISLITAFTNLFGAGGAPLCSIERGKRNIEKAQRIMNISFYMLILTAIVLTLVGILVSEPLLYIFGASNTTIQYALPYMRIYFIGTLFSMIALGMNPFINAQGFASTGMMTIFIGAIANIILDPIFIFGLDMGVQGAAIATVISQILSAIFVLRFLTGKSPELKLQHLKNVEFRGKEIKDVLSLGSSSFVMQCTNSLVQIACNSMLSQVGSDLYISCMTVINSVRQILEVPVLAIGDGSSPILSYNYGAGIGKGVKKAIRIITFAGVVYTLVAWMFIILFPQFFIHIFNSEPDLLQIAVPAMHVYFFAFVFQAFQYCGQTVFKSLNKKKQAIFFSLLRKVVIVVPLTFILPHLGFKAMGVFMAEPISNFVGGSICFITMLVTVYCRLDVKRNKE